MSRITLDPNFAQQLQGVKTPTELCDPSGRVLGRYFPEESLPPPLSRSEIDRRMQEESFTTDEVLEHLERQ
ncbi:MAG: hypothetical protein ACJ8C4_14910 [Gemmataceae bacterium]